MANSRKEPGYPVKFFLPTAIPPTPFIPGTPTPKLFLQTATEGCQNLQKVLESALVEWRQAIQRTVNTITANNPFVQRIICLSDQYKNIFQGHWQRKGHTNRLSSYNFAAILPGDSVAGMVVTSGVLNFLNIYNTLLIARLVLTWFPNSPPQIVNPLRGPQVINPEKSMATATYVGAFYPAPSSKLLLPSNASKQIRISEPKDRYARTRIASTHSRSTRVRSEHGFRMDRRQFLLSSSTLGLGFLAISVEKPVALAGDSPSEPVELRGPVTLMVKRPNPRRTAKEKEEAEEILWVQNIEATVADVPTFRVFINLPEANVGTSVDNPHYVGSFMDFDRSKRKNIRLSYKVGISECLEDLDASENESIFVTFVPGSGSGKMPQIPVKFSSVKIDYDTK